MSKSNIIYISLSDISDLINGIEETELDFPPNSMYLARDHQCNKYIALDNSTGDLWTKEFYNYYDAMLWLERG